jgi:hypothetical protein
VSGSSFKSGTVSAETLLKTIGLSFDSLENARPHVLFDGTRYLAESQSRRIMRQLYSAYVAQGGDSHTLFDRLNLVSVSTSYYPSNNIEGTDPRAFLAKQRLTIGADGPAEILSIQAWELTHGLEWHQAFNGFRTGIDGSVEAIAGNSNSLAEHQGILWELYELHRLVRTPAFRDRVRKEAEARGVDLEGFFKDSCGADLRRQK